MSKSPAKRVEYLESIVIGAGFLMRQLQARYGSDFSIGMDEQVRDCIKDCDEVSRVKIQREKRGSEAKS